MGLKYNLLSDIDVSPQGHDRYLHGYARDLNVIVDSINWKVKSSMQ